MKHSFKVLKICLLKYLNEILFEKFKLKNDDLSHFTYDTLYDLYYYMYYDKFFGKKNALILEAGYCMKKVQYRFYV